MSDLIITARTLKSLVDPVLPLAGRDDMMPVLTAVQVCVDGEWLTATATDRFVMGHKRIKGDWPKGWEALIPVTVLRTILRTYKPQRGDDPELTLGIADGSLTVSSSGGFADFLAPRPPTDSKTASSPGAQGRPRPARRRARARSPGVQPGVPRPVRCGGRGHRRPALLRA